MMSLRLPVVYIAGPYRARTTWRIQQNIRAAQETALRVWKIGAVALCPHANTALFDGEADDSVWLDGDLELLRRCDAVVMVNGWEQSQGATSERDFAKELKLPVFDPDNFGVNYPLIKDWVTAWKANHLAQVG